MRSLNSVLGGLVVVAGLGVLLSGCGDKGKDNNNNTAAVGTCQAGQILTTAGCGTVNQACYNGTGGGYVNNVCYPVANTVNPNGVNNGYTFVGQNCVQTGTNNVVDPRLCTNPNNNNGYGYGYGYGYNNCGGYYCSSNGAFSSLQYTSPAVLNPWMYRGYGYGIGAGAYLSFGFGPGY